MFSRMKINLLFKSTAIYIITGIINSAIPFLLLPILTRVLSPSEYGKVVMFSSVLVVLSALAGLSVHGAVSIKYFDKHVDHPRYLGTSLLVLIASIVFIFTIIIISGDVLSRYIGIQIEWIIVAVLASSAQFVVQLRLLMWQMSDNAIKYGIFLVSQTAMNLSVSLAFVLYLGYGWAGRCIGIVFSMFLFGIIALLSLHASGLVKWNLNVAYARSMLKFGIPLIPHSVGGLLMSLSDRFAITGLLGIEEAGVYAAAMQIGMVVLVISDACNKSFAPWLFKKLSNDDEGDKLRIVKYTYILFVAIPAVAFLFGWIAPWLLHFVVGSRYQNSSEVVSYIALGGGFGAMYYLVVNYVFYAEKTGLMACVALFSGVVNAILAVIFVKIHGAVGAAQAYMTSQAICFFLTWFAAARVYYMPWRAFLF